MGFYFSAEVYLRNNNIICLLFRVRYFEVKPRGSATTATTSMTAAAAAAAVDPFENRYNFHG